MGHMCTGLVIFRFIPTEETKL